MGAAKMARRRDGRYLPPRYTPIPDEILDDELSHLTGAELKVLLYIARRTFGYGKREDAISLTQLCEGTKTRDGQQIDQGTGLSRQGVSNAVKSLVDNEHLVVERRTSEDRGFETNVYRLNVVESAFDKKVGEASQLSRLAPSQPGLTTPSQKTRTLQETKDKDKLLSLARLLCQTMGHPEKPPKRVERDALKAVNELIEAGERPEQIARGIPYLPRYGEVYGPGFLVTTWPRVKRDLAALDQARDRAEAQRILTAEDEEQQAQDEAAWHVIQALPAEELEALRQAVQRDRPLLRDVGDNHPALQAAMIELWQERDDRQPRLMEA